MNLIKNIFSFICILCSQSSFSQWTTKAPIPSHVDKPAAAELNEKLYVLGGEDQFDNILSTTYEYDPNSDSWNSKASMLTAVTYGEAVGASNGKIYVFGGYTANNANSTTNTVQEYDPITDSWAYKTNMPTSRGSVAASEVNGIIYVIGGWASGNTTDKVEAYNINTDSWTTKTPMPSRRYHPEANTINDKIYVVGGWGSSGRTAVNEEYDPFTDSWTTRSPMNNTRYLHATGTNGFQLYVAGGSGGGASTESYSPITDSWTNQSNMSISRLRIEGAFAGGCFHVVGGDNGTLNETECSVLPIELLNFDAQWNNPEHTEAIVRWETASEVGNDYFEVERSIDGINFSAILRVQGASHSNQLLSYEELDTNPVEERISYYRLKQTDIDGNYSYSDVVPLHPIDGFDFINLYPNPIITDGFHYTVYTPKKTNIEITITNPLGQLVYHERKKVDKGISDFYMNTHYLNQGSYIIHLSTSAGDVQKSRNFVIKN